MDCGEYIDAESGFKGLVGYDEGVLVVKVESGDITPASSVPLSCTEQGLSVSDLFNLLLNEAGDAIKIL